MQDCVGAAELANLKQTFFLTGKHVAISMYETNKFTDTHRGMYV